MQPTYLMQPALMQCDRTKVHTMAVLGLVARKNQVPKGRGGCVGRTRASSERARCARAVRPRAAQNHHNNVCAVWKGVIECTRVQCVYTSICARHATPRSCGAVNGREGHPLECHKVLRLRLGRRAARVAGLRRAEGWQAWVDLDPLQPELSHTQSNPTHLPLTRWSEGGGRALAYGGTPPCQSCARASSARSCSAW